MSLNDYKFQYRRNLPHIQPKGATLFVTFRLYGSIPISVLEEWQELKQLKEKQVALIEDPGQRVTQSYDEQKRQFGRYDRYLDAASYGPKWLSDPRIAQLVADSIHYFDNEKYRLDTFCIMPNHGHVVFAPLEKADDSYHPLRSIMHSVKSYTAGKANHILNRTGHTFWQAESYDHVIRNQDEWRRIMRYVLNNPVKAGLVDSWEDWAWSYCKYL